MGKGIIILQGKVDRLVDLLAPGCGPTGSGRKGSGAGRRMVDITTAWACRSPLAPPPGWPPPGWSSPLSSDTPASLSGQIIHYIYGVSIVPRI